MFDTINIDDPHLDDMTHILWGVALDADGYIWTIPRMGDRAYRVDTTDHTWETFSGLNGAYTYSDMTGFTLQMVSIID